MINLRNLKSSELVTMYNAAADKLGIKHVNKFADKDTAVSRTRALMAKLGTEVAGEEVQRTSTIPPAAPVPADVVAIASTENAVAAKHASGRPKLARPAKGAAKATKTVRPTKAPAAKATKSDAERRMSFNFKPMKAQKVPNGSTSLRALCYAKMAGDGCKFDDVVKLVERFDAKRGKGNATTIDRRAYELVRLMHYALGYGIEHNETTGQIHLYS